MCSDAPFGRAAGAEGWFGTLVVLVKGSHAFGQTQRGRRQTELAQHFVVSSDVVNRWSSQASAMGVGAEGEKQRGVSAAGAPSAPPFREAHKFEKKGLSALFLKKQKVPRRVDRHAARRVPLPLLRPAQEGAHMQALRLAKYARFPAEVSSDEE